MARDDAPSFQFYPRDLVADPAVRLMSPEARGGYLMLICQAWMSDEPGVLEDDDAILSGLSELGPDRWAACKESIRRAFRQTSREGRKVLVQRRMVEEREAQRKRYEQAKEGARVTNEKRWPSVAQRSDSESGSVRTAVTPASASASASASARVKSEKIAAVAADASPNVNGREAVNGLIAGIAAAVSRSPAHPRAPLMVKVRSQVEALEPVQRNRLFQLAGWLSKSGMDLECVLRFVEDATDRLDTVRNLHAYYSPNGAARVNLEGHYRADLQDRESKRWKDEEWEWARQFAAWRGEE